MSTFKTLLEKQLLHLKAKRREGDHGSDSMAPVACEYHRTLPGYYSPLWSIF